MLECLLTLDNVLLFLVLEASQIALGFGLFVEQNKTFDEVILSSYIYIYTHIYISMMKTMDDCKPILVRLFFAFT